MRKEDVFESREVVHFGREFRAYTQIGGHTARVDNIPANLLAFPVPIDYAKRRGVSSMERALSAVTTLHEGKVITLNMKRQKRTP